jgi:hypothetical protein
MQPPPGSPDSQQTFTLKSPSALLFVDQHFRPRTRFGLFLPKALEQAALGFRQIEDRLSLLIQVKFQPIGRIVEPILGGDAVKALQLVEKRALVVHQASKTQVWR